MLTLDTYYDFERDTAPRAWGNPVLYFLVSGRGVGKTYSLKQHVIKEYMEEGKRFCYIRRSKSEIRKCKKEFFSDLNLETKYPNVKFFIKGDEIHIGDKVAGYILSLRDCSAIKSKAIKEENGYRIYNFIFDEFLLMHGIPYINGGDGYDEPPLLLEIISTLARDSDFKVFLLGNMTESLFSGWFRFFHLRPDIAQDQGLEFCHPTNNNNVILQLIKSKKFEDEVKQTAFGRLASVNKQYSDYAIENKSLSDPTNIDQFIMKRPRNAQTCLYHLKLDGKHYGIWTDENSTAYYMDKTTHPSCSITFAMSDKDMALDMINIKAMRTSFLWKSIILQFHQGQLFFSSRQVYAVFQKMMKLTRCE